MANELALVALLICSNISNVHIVATEGTVVTSTSTPTNSSDSTTFTAAPTVTTSTSNVNSTASTEAIDTSPPLLTTTSTLALASTSPLTISSGSTATSTPSVSSVSDGGVISKSSVTDPASVSGGGKSTTSVANNCSAYGNENCTDVLCNMARLVCSHELSCVSVRFENASDMRGVYSNRACQCSDSAKQYYLETTHGGECITASITNTETCHCETKLGITPSALDTTTDADPKHEHIVVAACLSFIGGVVVVVVVMVLRRMQAKKQYCFRGEQEEAKAYWEGASNRVTTKVLLKHSLQREKPDKTVNTNPKPELNTSSGPETPVKAKVQPQQKASDTEPVQPAYNVIVDTPEDEVKNDVNDQTPNIDANSDERPDNNVTEGNIHDDTVREAESQNAKEQNDIGERLTVNSAESLPESSRLDSRLYEMDRDSVRDSTTSQALLTIQNELFIDNNDAEF